MGLSFKPRIASLPVHRLPSVPPGVERVINYRPTKTRWAHPLGR
jgi:hypothetical protein